MPLKTQTLPCGRDEWSEERGGGEQRKTGRALRNISVHVGSVMSPWRWGGVHLGQWQEGFGEPVVGRVSAVVAVVVGPARRRGGIGLVVVFAERRGIVGGRVDVGLLERRWVEVGSLVWQQVVLIQRLEETSRESKRSDALHITKMLNTFL